MKYGLNPKLPLPSFLSKIVPRKKFLADGDVRYPSPKNEAETISEIISAVFLFGFMLKGISTKSQTAYASPVASKVNKLEI